MLCLACRECRKCFCVSCPKLQYALQKTSKNFTASQVSGGFKPHLGVSENRLNPIVPSLVLLIMKSRHEKWLAIIGNINPTCSGPNPFEWIFPSHSANVGSTAASASALHFPGGIGSNAAPVPQVHWEKMGFFTGYHGDFVGFFSCLGIVFSSKITT